MMTLLKVLDPEVPASAKPLIVGIGGTSRAGSSTDLALRNALVAAEAAGARTSFFGGTFLSRLPLFDPTVTERTSEQSQLIQAVREADGVIIATPSYHGGVSSLVKNALDLLEDLRKDERPYLDNRAVGCIVTAFGPQAGGTTITSLRSIIHALRGWPTPLAAALNTTEPLFDESGNCTDEKSASQISIVARQVTEFSQMKIYHDERRSAAGRA